MQDWHIIVQFILQILRDPLWQFIGVVVTILFALKHPGQSYQNSRILKKFL
jgi:hypothetical protein